MTAANDLKKGYVINMDGELWVVTDYWHHTPGNLRAMVQAKLKSLKDGRTTQKRFKSTEDVDLIHLERKKAEYLYEENLGYVFMDLATYEQFTIPKDLIESSMKYLLHNTEVLVTLHDGKPLGIDLPTSVVLQVTYTEPGARGNTATNVFKDAKLETGLEVKVPLFINIGDKIKVDTRSGDFLERSNT